MTAAKILRAIGAVGLIAGVTAGVSHAQTLDKRTLFTFNKPVAIPGVTLPPGEYLFRIADPGPTGSRRIIQVASPDGRKSYAMLFTYAADRAEVTSSPEVRFMETAADMPSAVGTWWYGGERTGYEFIYPKAQARKLAKGAAAPVLTTVEETTKPEETKNAHLEWLSPSGKETEVGAAGPVEAAGPTQVGTIASAAIAIPEAVEARNVLPKTASNLPLVGLLGLIALAAAGGLRVWEMARR